MLERRNKISVRYTWVPLCNGRLAKNLQSEYSHQYSKKVSVHCIFAVVCVTSCCLYWYEMFSFGGM